MRRIITIGVVFVALLFMINIVSISVLAATDDSASSGVVAVSSTGDSDRKKEADSFWWDFSDEITIQKADILTMDLREDALESMKNRVIFKHHGQYNDHCAIATGLTKERNSEEWGNYTSYQFIDAPGPLQRVRYCWYPDDFDYWANEYALFRVDKEEYPQYKEDWDSILGNVVDFCRDRIGSLYQDYSNLSGAFLGNDTSVMAVANPELSYTKDADEDSKLLSRAADRSKGRWYCSELIWAAFVMSTENPTVHNYLGICELDRLPYWHIYRWGFNDPEKIVLLPGIKVNSIIDNDHYVKKLWSANENEVSAESESTSSTNAQITEIIPLIEENVISNTATGKTNSQITNNVINNFVINVMNTYTNIKNTGKVENQDISDSSLSNLDTKVEKIQIANEISIVVNRMVDTINNYVPGITVIETPYKNKKTIDNENPDYEVVSFADAESSMDVAVTLQSDTATLAVEHEQNTNDYGDESVKNENDQEVMCNTNTETPETKVSIEELSITESLTEEKIAVEEVVEQTSKIQSPVESESQSMQVESQSEIVVQSVTKESSTKKSSTEKTTEAISLASTISRDIQLTSS